MIAFLHTTNALLGRFEQLTLKYGSELDIKHFVNEQLLKDAITKSKADSNGFQKEIEIIKQDSPDLIICTCSTYGEESDKTDDVHRIDRPIAEYLVKKYKTIGLAYTAASTKSASFDLLIAAAKSINKSITIKDYNCTSCWQYFEHGDVKMYNQKIAEKILEIDNVAEAIFLAQASMENSIPMLKDLNKEVVTSTEFGVRKLLSDYKKHIEE